MSEELKMRKSSRALCARALYATVLLAAGSHLFAQSQPAKPPRPAVSRADEMLELWNDIGNRLVAMAKDFPEDKYDFKLQKDQRTFAQNILHAAGVDFIVLRTVSGSNLGPDLGKDAENPTRAAFKTKADVVKLIEQAVSEGAKLLKEQGDAGLDKTGKYAFGNRVVHTSYNWILAIEHSGEHYGQLVGYYRANNMVPPESRPH
jgi:hypothetical protein